MTLLSEVGEYLKPLLDHSAEVFGLVLNSIRHIALPAVAAKQVVKLAER